MDVQTIFKELCRRFCIRSSGPIFGVKLNLHIYRTVKDFLTSFPTDVAVANVCKIKNPEVSYHVSERRYLNFSSGTFSEILVILTVPAVGTIYQLQ
jgi:hypothetical protein